MPRSYPYQKISQPSIEERRTLAERQAAERLAAWPADGDPSALVVLVLRLFPLDQPIYARRRYGLRELPLHRINQGLARYGLTLEGHSVRDCRLFVNITDWPGWFGGINPDKVWGLFELRREEEVPPPPAWLAAILRDVRARRGADASN